MSKETKADIMAGVECVRSKIIANNTVEYIRSNGERVIRLHHTDIITFSPDGRTCTLNSGRWQTVTTKDRINRYSSTRIYQELGLWYIGYGDGRVPFFDGIEIVDGVPNVKPSTAAKVERDKQKLGKLILKFCRKIRTQTEPLPFPSAGDCFFCQFAASAKSIDVGGHKATQYTPTGSAIQPHTQDINPDHLLSHLKEGYLHGSLIVNAMWWAGFTDQQIGSHLQMPQRQDCVANTVGRYLRAQLGLAA